MKNLLTICLLVFGFSHTADADVWKWVDAFGNTHYVETMKPIYTWVDEFGKVHYGDTPDHEDAVAVQFVWHSRGSLDQAGDTSAGGEPDPADYPFPGETPEQRAVREHEESEYCDRATEIYESYINAPQLYRSGPDGEREILSEEEAARTIAETKVRKDELCR